MTKDQLIANYQASRNQLSKKVLKATVDELSNFIIWPEYQDVVKTAKALEEHGFNEIINDL